MPKALYIDPNETLRPQDHELELPKIPVMTYNKTVKEELKEGNFTKEDLLRIYRDMSYIREFETMLNLSRPRVATTESLTITLALPTFPQVRRPPLSVWPTALTPMTLSSVHTVHTVRFSPRVCVPSRSFRRMS